MNIPSLEYHEVEGIKGFVTNIETQKTPQAFARSMLGLRNLVVDKVVERDSGTIHKMSGFTDVLGEIKRGYVLSDPDTGKSHVILVTNNAGSTHVYIETVGTGAGATWLELSETFTGTISVIGVDSIDVTSVTGLPTSGTEGWLIYNNTRSNATMVELQSGPNVLDIFGNTTTLGWVSTDTVTIYRSPGRLKAWDSTIGTEPIVNWVPNEVQRKVTMLLSDTTGSVPDPERPKIIKYFPARPRFYAAGSPLVTLAAGWDMYNGGGFDNSFSNFTRDALNPADVTTQLDFTVGTGSRQAGAWGTVGDSAVTANIFNADGQGWLNINMEYAKVPIPYVSQSVIKFAITAVYDDYQESDPFCQFFLTEASAWNLPTVLPGVPCARFRFDISPANMPRGLTGFNIYHSEWFPISTAASMQTAEYQIWADAGNTSWFRTHYSLDEQNVDIWDETTQIDWIENVSASAEYNLSLMTGWNTWYTAGRDTKGLDLRAALGRDFILENKGYVAARYGSKARRGQSAIIALDDGDTAVRLSTVDGFGVHQDDNFAEVSQDVNLNWHTIALSGHGRVIGIGLHNDILYVFRQSEIEMYDIQSGISRYIAIDIVSERSIIEVPWGIAWAGRSGIYFLEYGALSPQVINSDWANYYDGTLYDTGYTQKVSDSAREAIVIGFDQTYQELLVQILVTENGVTEYRTFRFSFAKRSWNVRYWNIGDAADVGRIDWFGTWGDNKLILGYGHTTENGIVVYPNRTGTYLYQDDVPYGDGSAGNGIRFELIVNIASLESLVKEATVEGILVDAYGTVANSRTLYMQTLTNEETVTRDTKQFPIVPIGTKPTLRRFPFMGPIEDMQLKFYFDSANLVDYKEFNIDSVQLAVKRQERIGNT